MSQDTLIVVIGGIIACIITLPFWYVVARVEKGN